jgi:hypothetical protein
MATGKEELSRHYRMFRLVFFSDRFNGVKMASIERKTKLLCKYFFGSEYTFGTDLERQEMLMRTKERIIRELYFNYFERGHYRKYDRKHSLSTWVVNYIYKNINNLVRKYRPRSLDEDVDDRSDIFDEAYVNFRVEYEDYLDFANISTSTDDPENILLAKELMNLMLGFFGELDLQVLLGMRDRYEVSEAQELTYDAYTKRLNKRVERFIRILKRLGYLD